MSKQTEIAWAAGFFDGEGTTAVIKAKGRVHFRLSLSITQFDPDSLHRFQKAVGAGRVYGPYGRRWSYSAQKAKDVHNILDLLWPYLGNIKRDQANAAIEKHNDNPISLFRYGDQCGRGHDLTQPRAFGKDGKCRLCTNERNRKYRKKTRKSNVHP